MFWRRIHLPQMLSGQQMNLEVLLMWTSLRSTLSSFFKHMCMRFSTTTPTETSFFRAAFLFLEAGRMFEDVFGRFWNLSTRCGWTTFFWNVMVNSNMLNSPNMVVRSLRRTFIFCMPPLPLQQHGTAETGEDQTMHVARARQLSWTDSLLVSFVFPVWKRNRGYCSEAVVNLGCFLFIRSTRS